MKQSMTNEELLNKVYDYLRTQLYVGQDDWNDNVVMSDRCDSVEDFIDGLKKYVEF